MSDKKIILENKFKDAFAIFDTIGEGKVKCEELKNHLEKMGILQLCKEPTQDYTITEFLEYLTSELNEPVSKEEINNSLNILTEFEVINNNKILTKDEISMFLKSCDENMKEETVFFYFLFF
jgi:Ca2+-binding EF-hand superfamily protein